MSSGPETAKAILRSCFLESAKNLQAAVKPLSAQGRQRLYQDLQKPLQALQKACRFSDQTFTQKQEQFLGLSMTQYSAKYRYVNTIFSDVMAHLEDLESFLTTAQISVFGAQDAGLFFLKLQLLQVALAPKEQVDSVFKTPSSNYPYFRAETPSASRLYLLGRTLLDRPEDWVAERLKALLERQLQMTEPLGLALLLQELLEEHPDWSESFAPFMGPAMFWDGFASPDLSLFPAQMILAGLAYEPPALKRLSPADLPGGYALDGLQRRLQAADMPRVDLVSILLQRLQTAPKAGQATVWLRLLQAQNVQPAEIQTQLDAWVRLLYAPTATAVKLAVRQVKGLLSGLKLKASAREAWLQATLVALNHPVQGAAQAAWELFCALGRAFPQQEAYFFKRLAPHLASPHPKLRLKMLKHLGPRVQVPVEVQTELQHLADSGLLTPLERAISGVTESKLQASPLRELEKSLASAAWLDKMPGVLRPRARVLLSAPVDRLLLASVDLPGEVRTWERYAEDPPLHSYASAWELAQAMVAALEARLNPVLLESFCVGVLQHPLTLDDKAELITVLEPVLALMRAWQTENPSEKLYQLPLYSLHLVHLVWGWLQGGKTRPAYPVETAAFRQLQLSLPLAYALMQQIEAVLGYLAAGHRSYLAAPEFVTGWIGGATFHARLQEHLERQPVALNPVDLGLALLRLAPAGRVGLWAALSELAAVLPPEQYEALCIALAPEEMARRAVESLVRRINERPPDDWILQARQSLFQPRDTQPNRLFQLLNRAIFCRCGLANAREAFPALKLLKQQQLLVNAGLDYAHLKHFGQELIEGLTALLQGQLEASEQEAWPALQQPQVRNLTLRQLEQAPQLLEAFWHAEPGLAFPLQADRSLGHMLEPQVLPYPQMALHVVDWLGGSYQPGYGMAYDEAQFVQPLTFFWPVLTQAYWRLAIRHLQRATELSKHEFAVALLPLGHRPYVRIQVQELSALLLLLRSKHLSHREVALKILTSVLLDGAVSPADLSDFWRQVLAGPVAGFKYALESIALWRAQGAVYELLLLLALESLWVQDLEVSSRNLSRILDLHLSLMETWSAYAGQQPGLRLALEKRHAEQLRKQRKRKPLLQRLELLREALPARPRPLAKMLRTALLDAMSRAQL